jgi:hypothetical protein
VIVNSYMLPHGTRPAAIPRETSARPWAAHAMIVSSRPSRPNIATRNDVRSSMPPLGAALSDGAAEDGTVAGTSARTAPFTGTVRRALHSTRWEISARK